MMFDAQPGVAARIRLLADARGLSVDHPARIAADALDTAVAEGTADAIWQASRAADLAYCKLISGDNT